MNRGLSANSHHQIFPSLDTLNFCNLPNFPPMAGSFDMDHNIDRLGDKLFRYGYDRFLDELFKSGQSGPGAVGVNGGAPSRVAGVPCLQKRQGFRSSYLSHHDPVGAEAHGGSEQVVHGGHTFLCPEKDGIRSGALQLQGVLDDHDPVVGGGDLVENSIDQGGLAGAGTSGNQDILFGVDRLQDGSLLAFRHDPLAHVVIERENQERLLPDREDGRLDNGGKYTLEAAAGARELGGKKRL